MMQIMLNDELTPQSLYKRIIQKFNSFKKS